VYCFLILRSSGGQILGVADEVSIARGNRVYSRLTIRFRYGSIDDETTVFAQAQSFHLVSDHHVQKGPSFPKPLDLTIDAIRGDVTWRETKSVKEEATTQHMDLPPDLANSMIPLLVENFPKAANQMEVFYLAGSAQPRLIKIRIKPEQGHESFRIGGVSRQAVQFTLHAEIPGVAGVIAPVTGRQPSDVVVWAMDGQVPTGLKMEGALYQGGPIWTLELASPAWPQK
jgi:hypothetical protein